MQLTGHLLQYNAGDERKAYEQCTLATHDYVFCVFRRLGRKGSIRSLRHFYTQTKVYNSTQVTLHILSCTLTAQF